MRNIKNKYDCLIVGGGAAGLSCALVLGSGLAKPFAKHRQVGFICHQKTSHMQEALFNNVLGIAPGPSGKTILKEGLKQLENLYPQVSVITKEKVISITNENNIYTIITNKNLYTSLTVVVAVGYSNLLNIKGLEKYVEAHPLSKPEKQRICLRNHQHKVDGNGLFVAGTLAGWRSQFAIASGSGAQVATDILTLWNGGVHTKVHNKVVV